ncbi:MAG: hypothetical protein Q7K54_05785 [Candidatus Parcubacteria bacterium]|nr:hypothetical protein [Candidatus Parcubacteria bacterium]
MKASNEVLGALIGLVPEEFGIMTQEEIQEFWREDNNADLIRQTKEMILKGLQGLHLAIIDRTEIDDGVLVAYISACRAWVEMKHQEEMVSLREWFDHRPQNAIHKDGGMFAGDIILVQEAQRLSSRK